MPTKYNYTASNNGDQDTGGNAITATINKDSGYPIRVDGDYTLSDKEHDLDIIVTASSGTSVTITLDPTELREGFIADIHNANGASIDFQVDGSSFSGTTTLLGQTGSSTDTDNATVFHLTPGEFLVAA